MSDATEELLPCPFCGGEATINHIDSHDDWWVVCRGCNIQQPSVKNIVHTSNEAIAAWNRRQPAVEPVPEGSYQNEDGDLLLEVNQDGKHILVWGHGLEEPFCLGCTLPDGWQLMRQIESPVRCRVCGCTDDRACEGGCHWVEDDLCSACVNKEEPQPTMAIITELIEEVKLLARGVNNLNHVFTDLEIAGVAYHGGLMLRRTFHHDHAWGAFARLSTTGGKHWMLDAYEDDPGVAFGLLKEKMLAWVREREAEAVNDQI